MRRGTDGKQELRGLAGDHLRRGRTRGDRPWLITGSSALQSRCVSAYLAASGLRSWSGINVNAGGAGAGELSESLWLELPLSPLFASLLRKNGRPACGTSGVGTGTSSLASPAAYPPSQASPGPHALRLALPRRSWALTTCIGEHRTEGEEPGAGAELVADIRCKDPRTTHRRLRRAFYPPGEMDRAVHLSRAGEDDGLEVEWSDPTKVVGRSEAVRPGRSRRPYKGGRALDPSKVANRSEFESEQGRRERAGGESK